MEWRTEEKKSAFFPFSDMNFIYIHYIYIYTLFTADYVDPSSICTTTTIALLRPTAYSCTHQSLVIMELTPLQHHCAVHKSMGSEQCFIPRKQLRPRGKRKPADNEGQALQPASCSRRLLNLWHNILVRNLNWPYWLAEVLISLRTKTQWLYF